MDPQSTNENTPLIQPNPSYSLSNSNLSNGFQQQATNSFFEDPNTYSYICRQPAMSNAKPTTSRSDESQLATLAYDKQMSVPRRTFSLFITFDLILTILLWLIEIGTSTGEDVFFKVLVQQITAYNLHTSLFDVVMVAVGRFLFLMVTYTLIRIRHYWPVAVSTAICDAALIVKVFAVFAHLGPESNETPLDVPMTCVVILTDFILTWIEVWLIDFKVIPAEKKLAQKTAKAFLQQSYHSAPSIDDTFFRRARISGSVFERGNFYSPAATPPPSEGGFTGVETMFYSVHGFHRSSSFFTPQQNDLIEKGKDSLNKLMNLFQDSDIWKVEKTLNNGDVVYSTEDPIYGKSFKLTASIIGRTPDVIAREIILKPEDMPSWNRTISDVKILQRIGEQTCVTLEVSAPAAMGLISSREFITVRRFEKRGDAYISAGISTNQCEDLVPKSNFVRGENGPTGFIVSPCASDSNSSTFIWVLNTDLKGNLSRTLVNSNLTRTMIDFVSAMKDHLKVTS